jgi:acyl-CoA synthetase (AMP-forming)/AMP-acid ligase II
MVQGSRRLTFAEAERESAALAKGLLALGVGKGTRLGLMLPNTADWALLWMAAGRIGALLVSLSTFFQARETAWALKHMDVDTLIVAPTYVNNNYLERLEAAVPTLAGQADNRALYMASHPYLRRIIVWGASDRRWALQGPEAILAAAAACPQIDDAFLREVESNIFPADDLMTICTSGSTAEPKAVLHTHGAAVRSTWAFRPYLEVRREDRIFNGMPFFWVGGLLRSLMPALYEGACLLFSESPRAEDALALIRDEQATFVNIWAGQSHAVRTLAAQTSADLSAVRSGVNPILDATGAPLPPERRAGGQMGMTETFGTHSADRFTVEAPPGKAGNWGRPRAGIQRKIVDPATGETLPPGVEGELHLRGRTVMAGYYKREREDVFTADGYFPTGDRCIIDEDDYIFFNGRLGEMIKTAGANVAPREVEALLHSFPEVREGIVLGLPDKVRGELVAAVVVPELGGSIDPEALRQKIRQEISSYKVPQLIVVMAYEDVPRTDSGKPKKPVLKAQLLEGLETPRQASA